MNLPYSRPADAPGPTPVEQAIDIAIAVGAFAAMLAILLSGGVGGSRSTDNGDALGVLLAGLSTLPLYFRRWNPFGVFVFTMFASTIMYGMRDPEGPPIGPTVALYFVGAAPDGQRPKAGVIIAFAAVLLLIHTIGNAFAEFLLGLAIWTAAWFAGDRTRLWRERIDDLEQRAVRAEQEMENERKLAAAEERTRIARDLHDSAAHAINVILVQAGAARLLQARDPERSRAALETVEEVARETLSDIDRIVKALRDGPGGNGGRDVEPPAGLVALRTLTSRHEAAGMAVDVRISGEQRVLPTGVDQAAYRILQEALTNAARHGNGRASVELTYGKQALEVVVTNPLGRANGAPKPGGAHGLVGMRERAALLGGVVDAAPSGGEFRLHATLPYGPQPAVPGNQSVPARLDLQPGDAS